MTTRSPVLEGVKNTELIALLLEALRGRTGRWDVIKGAISGTGDTVRLIAVILALAVWTGVGARAPACSVNVPICLIRGRGGEHIGRWMLTLSLEILGAAARQRLTAGQGEPGLGVGQDHRARRQGPRQPARPGPGGQTV